MEAKKFIVVYDWGYELSVHAFDTLEEAVRDRKGYLDPHKHPIYQLVEEKTVYTLPGGTQVVGDDEG